MTKLVFGSNWQRDNVTIAVYDISGRVVVGRSIELNKGRHEINLFLMNFHKMEFIYYDFKLQTGRSMKTIVK